MRFFYALVVLIFTLSTGMAQKKMLVFTNNGAKAYPLFMINHTYSPIKLSIFQKYSPWCLTNLIPDGAIFCKMENHIRNKLNFCFKIRAGYDETYERVLKQR